MCAALVAVITTSPQWVIGLVSRVNFGEHENGGAMIVVAGVIAGCRVIA